MGTLTFHYKFSREGRLEKDFTVELDAETLTFAAGEQALPAWTRLEHEKCADCPLSEKEHPHCPAAVALAGPIEYLKDKVSFEEYDVEITVAERVYKKTTALQNAASSLVGLLMATSGCPVMKPLKPMARTHLPFSSMEETLYRVISTYLFAQYFKHRRGGEADWDLKGLMKMYEALEKVNDGVMKRIKTVHTEDAGLNAVIHLDCFRHFANHSLFDTDMEQFGRYFA